ncbi:MAG: hypothetical protein IJN90_00715 [Bacilli bacterium]|nr:hypothetical protein [Bacilli bacterium]
MASLEDLEYTRRKYYNLREKVENVNNDLKKSLDDLEKADNNMINGYSIDLARADDNYLTNVKSMISGTYSNLVNNVLPSINSQIYSITKDIDSLEDVE